MTTNNMVSEVINSANSVKELVELKNKITAAIWAAENKIKEDNTKTFIEEILNLYEGVGLGYVPEDYYAPDRYYSNILGVKNFRFIPLDAIIPRKAQESYYDHMQRACRRFAIPRNNRLLIIKVKLYNPAGYLIPNRIDLRGITILVGKFTRSNNYTLEINY